MGEIKKLQVVLDADKRPLKQKLDSAKKDVKDFSDSADKSVEAVDFSPMQLKLQKTMEGMKKITSAIGKAISLDGQGYDMKGVKRAIREITADTKKYVKETQIASGIRVYNEDYLRMQKESTQLAEALKKVRASMLEMKKNGTDKQMSEQYQKDAQYLETLNAKYEKVSKSMGVLEGKKLTRGQQNRYKSMEEELQRLTGLITATENRMQEMESTGKNMEFTAAFSKAREEASQLKNQIEYLKQSTASMESNGMDTKFADRGMSTGSYVDTGFATAKQAAGDIKTAISDAVSGAKQKVQEFVKSIPVIGRAATEASALVKKGFGGMRAVMDKVTPAIKRAGGAAASLIKRFASGIPGVKRFMHTASGNDSGGGLQLGLKNLLTYGIGIQSLFALVNKLRSAMQAGLQNVAGASKTTRGSLNSLNNAFTSLQNAAGAAAAPLVNAFAPAITTIIGYVVDAINAVGMFIAALTGASSYTAAKFNKSTTSAASGLDKTGNAAQGAKKDVDNLKRSLMGFDEINKLDDNSNSGSGSGSGSGGSGGSAGGGFTTEQVSTDAQNMADKVKEIWSTIFDPMKKAWDTKGTDVINAWKGALGSIKDLALDIGSTFLQVWSDGTGYQTTYNILANVELIGQALDGVATAFKEAWDDGDAGRKYVKSLFDSFNSIQSLVHDIGKALLEVWNDGTGKKAIGDILGIFTNINNTIGNISGSLHSAFSKDNMGKSIIQGIADIFGNMLTHVNNITSGLKSWSSKLDFGPITKSINNLVKALQPLGDKVGAGLEWLFKNVLQPLAKWAIESAIPKAIDAIAAALNAIDAVIDAVSPALSWLWKNFFEPLAKWTGGVIASVLDGISNALKKIADLASGAGGWLAKLFGVNDTKVDVDINGNIVSTTDKTNGKSTVDSTANLNKANNSLTGNNKPSIGTTAKLNASSNDLTGKNKPSIGTTARLNGTSNDLTGKNKPAINTLAHFNASSNGLTGKDKPSIGSSAYFDKYTQKKNWYPTISSYATIIKTTNKTSKSSKSKKKVGRRANGGSFYGGMWHSIPQFKNGGVLTTRSIQRFADGGSPDDHGSVFIAGEAGPEIVGHVGGRTEVLNASQLASTMYSAVVAAMMAVYGKGNNTQVNVTLQGTAKAFFKVMQQEARNYTEQTGKPAFS